METAHLLSRLTFRIVVSSVSAHGQLRMGPDHQIARAEASEKISQFLARSNGIHDGDLIVTWGYEWVLMGIYWGLLGFNGIYWDQYEKDEKVVYIRR